MVMVRNDCIPMRIRRPMRIRKNGLGFPALTAPLPNYSIYVSILMKLVPNESLGYKIFNDI